MTEPANSTDAAGSITAHKLDVTTLTGIKTVGAELRATRMTFGNVVAIDLATGAIERLPGFTTTDAAALAFWRAVETLAGRPESRTNPRTGADGTVKPLGDW